MFAAENAGGSSVAGVIGAIIFLGLIAALIVFLVIKYKGRDKTTKAPKERTSTPRTKKAKLEAMSPEERAVSEAEKEYGLAVKQAEKQNQGTIKEWDKKVSASNKELQKANALGQRKLGSYGAIKLFEDHLETPQGTIYFEKEQATAAVDTAGNLALTKRVTVTRLLAGGIVGGLLFQKKKEHDSRELYLLIESESIASMVECKPEDGAKVRQLAVAIMNASKSWASVKQAKETAVGAAQRQLEVVTAQRIAELQKAEHSLNAVRSGTQRVDEAKRQLSASQVSPIADSSRAIVGQDYPGKEPPQ